jgi:uncharacterized protein YegJ (DUF2314 family)
MRAAAQLSALLLGLLAALWTGCSQRDRTISVKDDDPEMVAAIAKARETLPQFWLVFDRRGQGETNFALKVRITDKHGAEHFWAIDLERREGKILGTINNDPDIVASVKLGDRITIPEADISDWLYMRDGKMVGNHTIRPLFKKMSAKEVQQLKEVMAEP